METTVRKIRPQELRTLRALWRRLDDVRARRGALLRNRRLTIREFGLPALLEAQAVDVSGVRCGYADLYGESAPDAAAAKRHSRSLDRLEASGLIVRTAVTRKEVYSRILDDDWAACD